MKIDKVVFYGHKSYNTYGYIHSSYKKAFEHLGYKCFWINHFSELGAGFDFEKTLFLTEGQVDSTIPLNLSSYYILHHCDIKKYIDNNCKFIQLGNYLKFCEDNQNHYYPGDNIDKITDLFFIDRKNKLMYQPWATDLLPYEIDEMNPILFDSTIQNINFVGTVWNVNNRELNEFSNAASNNNKILKCSGRVSDEDHKTLIQKSYIAPDIRGEWHITCGYIPCRIFKNLSYGKLPSTNSKHVYDVFQGKIPYDPSPYNLFDVSVDCYKSISKKELSNLILFVKSNHTYINRINNIMKFFKIIYE